MYAKSVISQTYKKVEYIIIDGALTDATTVKRLSIGMIIISTTSCPGSDKGIYDAMNKGITFATGDVVGMLNADDYFSDDSV